MTTQYSPEIKAEMLLNLLYPDMKDKWTAREKGTFYRNYNRDILDIHLEENEVELSRDGFLRLLPKGMLTTAGELKGDNFEENYEELHRRLKLLEEAFIPIDTFSFRRRLQIESEVSELLNAQLDYLLVHYFGYDRSKETNPYIKALSVILPYVSKIRGNFRLIKDLLASLFDTDVELRSGRYSESDSTKCWLPWARYTIYIDHLDYKEYKKCIAEIGDLKRFIREWFVPFDTRCDIMLKQRTYYSSTNDALILNYNTKLK
jgi:hypothetical protein